MYNKKAMAIAVNTVVMLIIGITIFGLGMGLFGTLSSGAGDEVDNLNKRIQSDIASLECDGDEWICVPSYKLKDGNQETFDMFIANHGDSSADFFISLALVDIGSGSFGIEKSSCGSIAIVSLDSLSVSVKSGYSGSLPFIVKASRVTDIPCSFITTATLTKSDDASFEEKTSVIIRVE
jgi:hypothetical protein